MTVIVTLDKDRYNLLIVARGEKGTMYESHFAKELVEFAEEIFEFGSSPREEIA